MDKQNNIECAEIRDKAVFIPPIENIGMYDIIGRIWLDHYHKLTGRDGAPDYDITGSLFWWIVKYSPDFQTEILQMCFEAGYNAAKNEVRKNFEMQS
jgi:hypothetical protein